MTKCIYIFIPVFILFLTACSDNNKLPPLSDGALILAFGDSLTYGVGSKGGRAYPEALSDFIGFK
jgi:acyl-CoA thioesterase-1